MSARLPRASTLSELALRFGARLRRGDPERVVTELATLTGAQPGALGFYAFARHRADASSTRAGAVITSDQLAADLPMDCAVLEVDDPYACYAQVAQWIEAEGGGAPVRGIHPSAVIAAGARLGQDVSIGAHCVVEDGARLDDGVVLGPGCTVGSGSHIGAGTRLHAHVSVYHDCVLGARAIVHAGTVIGADGFGFAPHEGRWQKIPQLGRVLIGDDVEIGANCCIDRGALDDTVIADGCKLDNLIQVAHNVRIGEHSALAGCVGIAGSAVIGKRCRIGGSAGILGHLTICDDVTISPMTLVASSITDPGTYSGIFPLMTHVGWEKAAATLRRLPDLRERLRRLEKLSKG